MSVVAGDDVTAEGQREMGQTCTVRIGKRMFPGKIAARGKLASTHY